MNTTKFDILNFYRDNIIAESGTAGDWVDVAYMPKVLGHDLTERIMKWKAYKKSGIALIDSSQEGMGPMNTTFGGYDDSVKLQAIQAVELAIQRVEETCSTITGVFREKLGGIEQLDAVSNVRVGIRQSSYITKQYFYSMDLISKEILLDILDICKIVYKKGLHGTIILGDSLSKVFTALPEHYTLSDFDIHIADSAEIIKDSELIKQLSFELARNNSIDPELIINMVSNNSLTKLKREVSENIAKKKKENDFVGQLQQQLDQASKQLKQMDSEMKKLQNKLSKYNQEEIELDKQEFEHKKELDWYKVKIDREFKEETVKNQERHIQAEVLELYDGNPKNNEIKDPW